MTGYYKEGYVMMQNLIMKAFMKVKGNEKLIEEIPKIFVRVRNKLRAKNFSFKGVEDLWYK